MVICVVREKQRALRPHSLPGGGADRSASWRRRALISSKRAVTSRKIAAIPCIPAGVVAERQDREFDRDAPAVLAHRRHGQDLAGAVARLSALHRRGVALPMPAAQVFGNDQIEGL